MAKRYADRDVVALGQLYLDHVGAMTSEGLHDKSDIAAELAWRDQMIENYKDGWNACDAAWGKEVEEMEVENKALSLKLDKREKGVAEMMADLRGCADFLGNDGYSRWRNTLLNIGQSIAAPETYRRLP